jgi:hypothetical protein
LSIVVVLSLLIAGFFENGGKIQQAIAGTFTSLQSTNNNNNNNHNGGTLNVGPPEKITVTEHSKPPVLSPEKRQALQQDQAKTHHSPELPISDQAVKGPKPGTQAQ